VSIRGRLGDPAHVTVVDLLDGDDAVHELRELLELRPLVVRNRHWNVHFDGLSTVAISNLRRS
jgi:hypothetical protein